MRTLRRQFWDNNGMLEERKQGKYERMKVYGDEELNRKAAEWVRANAFLKGQPNMTAQSFCVWVNEDLLPSSHLPPHFPRSVVSHLHSLAPSFRLQAGQPSKGRIHRWPRARQRRTPSWQVLARDGRTQRFTSTTSRMQRQRTQNPG